jgi:hypothetical protein
MKVDFIITIFRGGDFDMGKGRKKLKYLLAILAVVILVGILQCTPIWKLKTSDMQVKEGQYVEVYYQAGDEDGAFEVYDLLEASAKEIREKLQYSQQSKTKMYIYKNQTSLHIRKAGFITLIFAPEWYIGDNKKDVALMVSPYAEVSVHDHDSILSAAPHELIHAINYQINPKLSYWLDNGIAGYLSKQTPSPNFMKMNKIPTFKDTKTENEIKFGKIGGYNYSYSYVEYLDKTYGWDKVIRILKGESYKAVFSKSEEDIYNEWVLYLQGQK